MWVGVECSQTLVAALELKRSQRLWEEPSLRLVDRQKVSRFPLVEERSEECLVFDACYHHHYLVLKVKDQ